MFFNDICHALNLASFKHIVHLVGTLNGLWLLVL